MVGGIKKKVETSKVVLAFNPSIQEVGVGEFLFEASLVLHRNF